MWSMITPPSGASCCSRVAVQVVLVSFTYWELLLLVVDWDLPVMRPVVVTREQLLKL